MATSSNPKIQKLMDAVEAIDPTDNDIETKLMIIAQKVAAQQRKMNANVSAMITRQSDDRGLVDPGEAFACEGCQ